MADNRRFGGERPGAGEMAGIGDKIILLGEDNPDDELLTMRALERNNVLRSHRSPRRGRSANVRGKGEAGPPPLS